jgi:uncharacterized protein YheU (UPF0270 family)
VPRNREQDGDREPFVERDDGADPELEPVEVPYTALSADALRGLVEEFVTRDGTDYGVRERTLDEKIRDVMRQLERGEVKIMFDPASRSANLVAVGRS